MSKPYRPSNGTEGEFFYCDWCAKCARENEDDHCEILTRSMVFSIGDDEYPVEWVEDEDGPRCTAFLSDLADDTGHVKDRRQMEMFA